MITTLVMTAELAQTLRQISTLNVESAGVLLVTPVASERSYRLLAVEYVPVPDGAYARRDSTGLVITSQGYVDALSTAETRGLAALWVHSHVGPGATPRPSIHDEIVDQELAETFRVRTGQAMYGSVVVALDQKTDSIAFEGSISEDYITAIDRFLVIGDDVRLIRSDVHVPTVPAERFDRNIRAFGGGVQRALAEMTVAIIGCGGTGSAVAEQLARLGVRDFILVDPDRLSASNITRVYGSSMDQVGSLKVDVVATNIRRIASDAGVTCFGSSVNEVSTARALATADWAFGCTDDNAGRLVLSRLPTFVMVPVVDCGVLLDSLDGQLRGIFGRVTTIMPGAACLVCRGRIDLVRARAETLPALERAERVKEGYAPELPGVEPAVVTFTTLVASMAVNELLDRLVGYGERPLPTEVVVRLHDRELSSNSRLPNPGHYCDPAKGRVGRGLTSPYLDLTWAA